MTKCQPTSHRKQPQDNKECVFCGDSIIYSNVLQTHVTYFKQESKDKVIKSNKKAKVNVNGGVSNTYKVSFNWTEPVPVWATYTSDNTAVKEYF